MKNQKGFTLLELIIVISIGAILTGIVIVGFSRVQGQLGARSAQSNFLSLHSQARAFAVERGQPVRLVVNAANDVVRIETDTEDGGVELLNSLAFGSEFGVDIQLRGGGTQATVVFTPRGAADPSANSFQGTLGVTFQRGQRVRDVEVLQLGQAREVGR